MQSVKYTGTNYEEVKALCGDKVLMQFATRLRDEGITFAP